MKGWHIAPDQPGGLGGSRLEGLQTCGSPWACPVCATIISERRKKDLEHALNFAHGQGWSVFMFTYTVPHNAGQSLKALLGHQARGKRSEGTYEAPCGLMGARGLVSSGKVMNAAREACGVVGSIRALEVTHGENGWHPHVHELVIVKHDEHIGKLYRALLKGWGAAVEKVGLGLVNEHGFKMDAADADVAGYVAKFGHDRGWNIEHELTKQVTKKGHAKGRTPTQLLADYTFEGDIDAGARWTEYALTMRGSRQLYWSPGLRAAVGLGAEKSDEETATEAEKVGLWFVSIKGRQFKLIVADDMVAHLRWLLQKGDLVAVLAFLDDYPDMRRDVGVKTWRLQLDRSEEAAAARGVGLTKREYLDWLRGGIAAIAEPATDDRGGLPHAGSRTGRRRRDRREVRKQCDERDSELQELMFR